MVTRIHPLCTGTTIIKESLRHGRGWGPCRRAAIFTDQQWTLPLPITCWLIEHEEGPVLVDAGEVAGARDLPFAHPEVPRDEEVDVQLERAGVWVGDLRRVVITHAHGDHIDGMARLPAGLASISAEELRLVRSPGAALQRRALGISLPRGFDPEPLHLEKTWFGAFARSLPLTADGTVVAVATPGHTPGHISVIVVIDGIHHFLAGDAAYDQGQLLELRVDGLSPSARRARETMRTILRHAAKHPTVFLPTHDVASRERLMRREELRPV